LAGVAAIALGLDTGILARLSTASTGGLEQSLVEKLSAKPEQKSGAMMAGGAMMAANHSDTLPVEGQLPPLDGAVQWLNSEPLTAEALKGKVVLV
ncbi:cytochrome c biogenesis protein DipZ, partial [Salmonella enterica subsp. enterica]